jgi:hypothetical protein
VEAESPANTVPLDTAGELTTYPAVFPIHSGWHSACPHPFASNAYSPPNCDPTYTTPPTTVGEESPTATRAVHNG